MPQPADRRLRPGDVVGVSRTISSGPMVGQIDRIHWDTDPVWLSLIDVDTGERHSAQLQYVIDRLESVDPSPRRSPDPPPAASPPDVPRGIGLVNAD